jgi:hypothetical protein
MPKLDGISCLNPPNFCVGRIAWALVIPNEIGLLLIAFIFSLVDFIVSLDKEASGEFIETDASFMPDESNCVLCLNT